MKRIDFSYKFLKTCIRKITLKRETDWDEVVNIAYVAYNLCLNGQRQDPNFFMFGEDIYVSTLANFLQVTCKSSKPSMERFSEAYIMAGVNLKIFCCTISGIYGGLSFSK